jgi:hypothetical protein
MQKVYYFITEENSIPIVYERDLVNDYAYNILVIIDTKPEPIYKAQIKYSTDKKEIEDLWRDYCLETLTNLEGELLDLQRQYCEGPNFQ